MYMQQGIKDIVRNDLHLIGELFELVSFVIKAAFGKKTMRHNNYTVYFTKLVIPDLDDLCPYGTNKVLNTLQRTCCSAISHHFI